MVGEGVLLDRDLSDLYREFSSRRFLRIVSLKTKSELKKAKNIKPIKNQISDIKQDEIRLLL